MDFQNEHFYHYRIAVTFISSVFVYQNKFEIEAVYVD